MKLFAILFLIQPSIDDGKKAVYKNDILEKLITTDKQRSEKYELYLNYTMPENVSGYKLSAFLFDSLTGMKPLADRKTISVSSN